MGPVQFPGRFLFLHEVFGVEIDQVPHDHGDLRIKLRSRSFHDLFPDQLLRGSLPVDPVGRQRIICVRHGNNPGNLGNLFPFQSVRISCAVVPFMMIMGADADIGIIPDTGKNLVSQHRMLLDFLIFFRCQVCLFVDNGVRDADLSDVVQHAGIIDPPAFFLIFAHQFGNPPGVLRDAHGMPVGIFVLGVDGRNQRRRDLFKQALRLLLLFRQPFQFFMLILVDPLVPGPDQNDSDKRQQSGEYARDAGQVLIENYVPGPDRHLQQQCGNRNNKSRFPVKNHQADHADIRKG